MAIPRRNLFLTLFLTMFLTMVAAFALTVAARAQESAKGSDADIAAIKQTFADFYRSFSKQDAHGTGLSQCFRHGFSIRFPE